MNQHVSRRTFLSVSAASLAGVAGFGAQNPHDADDATSSGNVRVVNVIATVRDKQGRIIPDLTKDDFELIDGGWRQNITYFSRETDLPLTLGLLVGTSCGQRAPLQEDKIATRSFIRKVLREEKDQTFLMEFDAITELLQELTPDRAKLETGLARIQRPNCRLAEVGTPGNVPDGTRGVGNKLYDAIALASDKMRNRTGRKGLILLTDGVDLGSGTALVDTIERVHRADALVYSIFFESEEYGEGFGDFGQRGHGFNGIGGRVRVAGQEVLQRISRESGGGYFAVSAKMSIEQIYDRIAEELRAQYNLGFSPAKSDSRAFHKLRINVKTKNLVVQTREGSYQSR
jgi:VWFA-related protein